MYGHYTNINIIEIWSYFKEVPFCLPSYVMYDLMYMFFCVKEYN